MPMFLMLLFACGVADRQPQACAKYVKCSDSVFANSNAARLLSQQTYGEEGTCWEGEQDAADLCEAVCKDEIRTLYDLAGDPACGSWGGAAPREGRYTVRDVAFSLNPCDLELINAFELTTKADDYIVDRQLMTPGKGGNDPLCPFEGDTLRCETEDGSSLDLVMQSWSHMAAELTNVDSDCPIEATFTVVSDRAIVP